MRTYVVERDIPGIGIGSAKDLADAAAASNAALAQLAPKVQWVHSYVTGDKTFCIYFAENETVIHEHARISGFPVNNISRVVARIDPASAA